MTHQISSCDCPEPPSAAGCCMTVQTHWCGCTSDEDRLIRGQSLAIARAGGEGGNLDVEGNATVHGTLTIFGRVLLGDEETALHNHAASQITSGVIDRARLPYATLDRAGVIYPGTGLTVGVQGWITPGKAVGKLDLDFLEVEYSASGVPIYDTADTEHPIHAAAAREIADRAAEAWVLSHRTDSITPSPTGGGSGGGPQPTGGGSDDGIPTVGAVIDYVDEAVASAAADGLAAAREVYTFAGDGAKKSFPIQHTLMEKEVLASVLDSSGSAVIVRIVFQAVNNLLVMFADPPAAGEQFTIVLCK